MNYHEPFTLNFKIVRTTVTRPFTVDLSWTMTEFLHVMREQVFYEFLLDNVDFVDDTDRHNDRSAEDEAAIQPSNLTMRQKYMNKISQVAFYIRPRVEEHRQSSYYSCVICLYQDRNMVFSPCHHLCACSTCGSNPVLTSCPICRTNITERQIVYV